MPDLRLLYRIALHGPEVRLAATVMDGIAPPETLLRSPDTASGWQTVRGLGRALEVHEVKSLQQPIEARDGCDVALGWVIG